MHQFLTAQVSTQLLAVMLALAPHPHTSTERVLTGSCTDYCLRCGWHVALAEGGGGSRGGRQGCAAGDGGGRHAQPHHLALLDRCVLVTVCPANSPSPPSTTSRHGHLPVLVVQGVGGGGGDGEAGVQRGSGA